MKVALMSTFFHGEMLNYLKWYCEELRTYFDKVVLLVFEPLAVSDQNFLQSVGGIDEYLLPENRGFDFGAWYHGLNCVPPDCTHLAFVNDSCVAFRSLKPFFAWFDKNNCDYAGLTNNLEFTYHIQSYFIVVRGQATVKLVKEFFSRKGIIADKQRVIQEYEIGLARHMPDHNIKIGCLYDCKVGKINWTMKKPVELLEAGFPMIKRKLGVYQYAELLKNIAANSCDNVNIDYLLEGLEQETAPFEHVST